MKTLGGALRRGPDAGGAFLPGVFRKMEDAGMRARMGTVTVVAGPPGSLKTAFTLYYVLRAGLPCQYWSADAEDFEMDERAAAAITGDTMNQVQVNPEAYLAPLEEHASHIRAIFNDSPTYEDLSLDLAAYAEVYGEFPKVLVLDNLMNLVGENENEWAGMRDHMRVLHKIARITGAAVFVLHHMSDDRADTTTPASRNKLQGRIAQLPKAVWSLALDGDRLKVAAVKSKVSAQHSDGGGYVEIFVTPHNGRFYNSHYDMQNGVPA